MMKIRDHREAIKFFVTKLGKRDIFLGYTWLWKHNPEIDWVNKQVNLTHCPEEACRPRERAVLTPEQGNQTPHNPDTAVSAEDDEDELEDVYVFTCEEENKIPQEIRRLLIRATHLKVSDITAVAPKNPKVELPEWILEYREVFELEGFQELPLRRPWDHAIDLKEGTGPWSRT